ncbi:MAG: SUMF1/EgtB/PvdO family nonheme iron enzyme [Polyangiaceae bacterium]
MVLFACQSLGGYEDFEASAAASGPCRALPLAKDDPLGLAVMARVDIGSTTCIWIDEIEVTVEQYARWQSAVAAEAVVWEPTWCPWKTTRSEPASNPDDACVATLPAFDSQPFASRKPIRCVDFCDAEAFCRWAGKRLCYDGSGLGTQAPRGVPKEWNDACSNGLSTIYPWGNDGAAEHCNTSKMGAACVNGGGSCGPLAVGQSPACSTASGVKDLLGNVAEWVFSCNYVDPTRPLEPTGCLTRGGSYAVPLQTCNVESTLANDTRTAELGFRCCADLTAAEQLLVR